MLALAIIAAVTATFLLASIDADAVQTGVAVAVAAMVAVGTTRFVSRWLMKSARAEFQDQVSTATAEVVREELQRYGTQLQEHRKELQQHVETQEAANARITAELALLRHRVDEHETIGNRFAARLSEQMESTSSQLEAAATGFERNSGWIKEIAEQVGITLREPGED